MHHLGQDNSSDRTRRDFLRTASAAAIAGAGLDAASAKESGNAPAPSETDKRESQTTARQPTGGAESADDIPRRPLGRTGARVSVLGVGGHHLGDLPDVEAA